MKPVKFAGHCNMRSCAQDWGRRISRFHVVCTPSVLFHSQICHCQLSKTPTSFWNFKFPLERYRSKNPKHLTAVRCSASSPAATRQKLIKVRKQRQIIILDFRDNNRVFWLVLSAKMRHRTASKPHFHSAVLPPQWTAMVTRYSPSVTGTCTPLSKCQNAEERDSQTGISLSTIWLAAAW